MSETPPALQTTIRTPAPVSSLVFGRKSQLFVGSDDGSVRLYNLPSTKVVKAINNLGSEISSMALSSHDEGEHDDLWLSCGTKAYLFHMNNPKLILSKTDAVLDIDLGEDAEDVLNEISLSPKNKHLAFSTDGGVVGVVDLSINHVSRMKTRHGSICGSVKFIPDRNEFISGGYDSALLHFDFIQGSISSRFDIAAPHLPEAGISLSLPFIHSISLSSSGIVAISTADGRIWIGHGGEKREPHGNKKRSRKWGGLKPDEGIWIKAAEGPVVSVAFDDFSGLTACTLLGTVIYYARKNDSWQKIWTTDVKELAKINAMQIQVSIMAIGGLDSAGKGLVEVFHV